MSFEFSKRALLFLWLWQLRTDAFQQNFGKIGFFWQIDSLHVDYNFTAIGDKGFNCWKNDFAVPGRTIIKPDGPFGDFKCNSPSSLLESTLNFMKSATGDNADFILWTGNSVPELSDFPSSFGDTVLSNVTDTFRITFPYTSVYPALGNLDLFPQNALGGYVLSPQKNMRRLPQQSRHHRHRSRASLGRRRSSSSEETLEDNGPYEADDRSKTKYEFVADLWENWLPPRAVETLKKGGYYTVEFAGEHKVRLICVNMNLYLESHHQLRNEKINPILLEDPESSFTGSRKTRETTDPKGQWAWLNRVLSESKRKKQNVIIFGHSPPGKYERSYSSPSGHHWLQESYNRRYIQIIKQYSDIIIGQFFGHQHTDSFRIFKNDMNEPISWAMLSPSVSPYKRPIPGEASGISSNPAVRLYRYNTHTGQILDYAQYYMDLEEANNEGKAHWRLEYNSSLLYELRDPYRPESGVTPRAMQVLVNRFKSNRTWFDAYIKSSEPCDDRCKQVQICAVENVDYSEYQFCITSASIASSSAVASSGAETARTIRKNMETYYRFFYFWVLLFSFLQSL